MEKVVLTLEDIKQILGVSRVAATQIVQAMGLRNISGNTKQLFLNVDFQNACKIPLSISKPVEAIAPVKKTRKLFGPDRLCLIGGVYVDEIVCDAAEKLAAARGVKIKDIINEALWQYFTGPHKPQEVDMPVRHSKPNGKHL